MGLIVHTQFIKMFASSLTASLTTVALLHFAHHIVGIIDTSLLPVALDPSFACLYPNSISGNQTRTSL
jgi:hypothetical protein